MPAKPRCCAKAMRAMRITEPNGKGKLRRVGYICLTCHKTILGLEFADKSLQGQEAPPQGGAPAKE